MKMISAVQWSDGTKILLIAVAAILLCLAVILLVFLLRSNPDTVMRIIEAEPQSKDDAVAESKDEATPESKDDAAAKGQDDAAQVDGNSPTETYTLSFIATVLNGDDELKAMYVAAKNELLRYGLVGKLNFDAEVFRAGRRIAARLCMSGDALVLALALDREQRDGIELCGKDIKLPAATPLAVRVNSEEQLNAAISLVGELGKSFGLERADGEKYVLPELGKLVKIWRG